MKLITFISIALSLGVLAGTRGPAGLADGARMAVVGDSFTQQGNWPSWADYVASYLALGNPDKQIYFVILARSGAAVGTFRDGSGTQNENYSKWVAPYLPDFVLSMWADNGSYSKETYKSEMELLIANHIVGQNQAKPILVGMMPTPTRDGYPLGGAYDDANQELSEAAAQPYPYVKTWQALAGTYTKQGANAFVANAQTDVLASVGHNLKDGDRVQLALSGNPAGPAGLSATLVYFVVNAMSDSFQLSQIANGPAVDITSNGSGENFASKYWAYYAIAPGNTHPSTVSSVVTAWKVITGLGWETEVSQASINAQTRTVTSQTDCAVTGVVGNSYGGIDFQRLDKALPWAIDESFSPSPATRAAMGRKEAVDAYPAMAGWQKYLLAISGLTEGVYDVFINGEDVADVSAADLSAGWNMADLTIGPVWRKGQEVLAKHRLVQGFDPATLTVSTGSGFGAVSWRSLAASLYTSGIDQTAYASAMAAKRAYLDGLSAAVKAAAQPELLNFSLRRQQPGVGNEGVTGLKNRIVAALAEDTFPMPPGIPSPGLWGTTDPINSPIPADPPEWPSAQSVGNYYVDKTHPQATDASNPYGYPAKPRFSFPDNATISAGKRVHVEAGDYDHTGGDNAFVLFFTGTEAKPAWATFGPSVVSRGAHGFSGSYFIIDGITVNRGTHGMAMGIGRNSATVSYPAHHACMRNSTIEDDGNLYPGFGAGLGMLGYAAAGKTHDIVIFNCDISNLGDVEGVRAGLYEDDMHGIVPGKLTERIWIIGNRIHHCAGDSIQPNGNNVLGEDRARYLYIGYNEFYHNGENAVDLKSGRDVIVSSNLCHDFRPGFGSDGTALIAQQEGGSGSENCWFIFNEVYDANVALRVEEVSSPVYAIGNVFHDLGGVDQAVYARTQPTKLTLVDNTICNMTSDGIAWDGQASTAPTVELHGNIVAGKADDAAYWIHGDSTTNNGASDYNVFDADGQFRTRWNSGIYTSLVAHQAGLSRDAHSVVGAIGMVDPAGGNFALTEGSIARNLSMEHGVYAEFHRLYGLDIRLDFEGHARPASGAWNAGAHQGRGRIAAPRNMRRVQP